jgi:2-polyprenyl-6-methoxyphenol hydroxylase-like FAD-dependent oxidoreductase
MTYTPISSSDVLVVGAGPTGLVLALWLARLGIRVRIVDKTAEAGTTSRAMAVQARTLEFYAQLGIADSVVAQGRWATAANFWSQGRPAAHVEFGALGQDLSPFPYALIYPQDEHEHFLIECLAREGVKVERNTEFAGFQHADMSVRVQLIRPDGTKEFCRVGYVAGCDGAHSAVRERLGIGFPGGTYEHTFYVADVEACGRILNGELNVALDRSDFLVVFPLKGEKRARLIGMVRDEQNQGSDLTWEDVNKRAIERLSVDVHKVNWFSTYRVHHRVAEHFRAGRIFLLGDAAHVHSPVGGQGMNTGIGDAVNLAWKLAAVLRGANPSLLETYEAERIAFARRLVETTDRAFTQATSSKLGPRLVRLRLAPLFAKLFFALGSARRTVFRIVSQTSIHYRGSELSEGIAGAVHGGDRLPWVRLDSNEESNDNFAPLRSLDWQVHVYGEARAELIKMCEARGLALHVFDFGRRARIAGLRRNAAYLLRPDGYVAYAEPDGDPAGIDSYIELRSLVPRRAMAMG